MASMFRHEQVPLYKTRSVCSLRCSSANGWPKTIMDTEHGPPTALDCWSLIIVHTRLQVSTLVQRLDLELIFVSCEHLTVGLGMVSSK